MTYEIHPSFIVVQLVRHLFDHPQVPEVTLDKGDVRDLKDRQTLRWCLRHQTAPPPQGAPAHLATCTFSSSSSQLPIWYPLYRILPKHFPSPPLSRLPIIHCPLGSDGHRRMALHLGILFFTPMLMRHHMADPSTDCGHLT